MKPILKTLAKLFLGQLPKRLRYALYRSFVNVPSEIPDNLVFKVAETKDELEAALVMLHDAYVGIGLLGKPDPTGIRVTAYHALPSSTTLIGKIGEEVVATLTVIRDNPMGLASDNFVDLSDLRKRGDRIAEISALAIKPAYRGKLLFHLLKFMYESCVNYLGVNHLIAMLSTRTKGYELYESILFFTPFKEQKQHVNLALNSTPLRAMHLNLDEAYGAFEKHYSGKGRKKDLFHFFTKETLACNQFPQRHFNMINYVTMNIENFKYFFTERTSVLKSLSLQQLQTLKHVFQGMPHEALINGVLKDQNILFFSRKRSTKRFEVSFKTHATIDGHNRIPLRVLDISREGLRVSCKEELSHEVQIEFTDSTGNVHSLIAQKAWENGHGIFGFQVISVNESWYEIIDIFENGQTTVHSQKTSQTA